MIDWVHDRCTTWGMTRYFIDNGSSHPASIFGRIKDGWSIAAAQGSQRPDPPEVMLGDALDISIAIRKAIDTKQLTEKQFQVLYVHYVERAPTKAKIYAVKVSKKRYYDILHRCHRVLRRHLPVDNRVGDNKGETDSLESDISTREAQCA